LTYCPGSEDAFELLDEVLTDVVAHHAIDPDRVILCGISSGGSAVWAYAKRHPHRFSALAPLATTVVPEQVEGLTSIPIWAFQSAADGDASVENVGQFVDRLRQQGGPAHLTIVKSQTHDCWTQAFKDYGLTEWMLSQLRQSSEGTCNSVSANSRFRSSWFRRKSCYRIMLSGCLLVIAFIGLFKMVGIGPLSRR